MILCADMAKVPISAAEIADRHNLKLITDTAQAPGAIHNGYSAGTQADIGGFVLTITSISIVVRVGFCYQ